MQGFNCQAVTAADGLILVNGAGTSPVDSQYYAEMAEKAVAAAELITRNRPPDLSGQAADESIGILLSDAGYCTKDNLTAPGPDRLIATGKSRDLHTAARDNLAEGSPPDDSDPTSPKPRSGTPNTTSASDGSPAAAWPGHAANGTSTPPCTTSARSSATSPEHHCPPNPRAGAPLPS